MDIGLFFLFSSAVRDSAEQVHEEEVRHDGATSPDPPKPLCSQIVVTTYQCLMCLSFGSHEVRVSISEEVYDKNMV